MANRTIPIVIPSYEPDDRLITLLEKLREQTAQPVILVDDGSGTNYNDIFAQAKELVAGNGGVLLIHEENRGKGRALKTAFEYVLKAFPDSPGVVTADSDGQHSPACIGKVADALEQAPEKLILGVRDFNAENVPWKSAVGNKITMKVMKYLGGISVSDTQTGLRGIPSAFMEQLLSVKGERFEFETQMLIESVGRFPITEVAIETIYDSRENHQTHFNPFKDSVRIYKLLLVRFVKYLFSSLSSSLVDLGLFTLFCYLLKGWNPDWYLAVSTILARVISATYNYFINYKVVFKSEAGLGEAAVKYASLAVVQGLCSAALVTVGARVLRVVPDTVVKVIVDTILFFVSYYIQQMFVFRKKKAASNE